MTPVLIKAYFDSVEHHRVCTLACLFVKLDDQEYRLSAPKQEWSWLFTKENMQISVTVQEVSKKFLYIPAW